MQRASGKTQEEEKETTKAREKEAKRLRLRAKSIKELVETEIQYVEDLEVLTEVYIEPLSPSNCNIINAEQHRLLFNNIPALIKLNTQFKVGLCARYKDWDPLTSKIAPEFLQFAPYFHMYQGYLNSHEQAAGLVAKLYVRSSKFKKFIDSAQCNPKCKNLDLRSYLVKPLQRITKYSLLLRELMKHTSSSHPDYGDLQLAQTKIAEVNQTINEKMKTFDQRQKVRDIQARFTQNNIDLVSPARYFIKEGKLTKICRKKDVAYIFILFSDLLIYGEQTNTDSKENTYQIKIHQQIAINQSFKTRDIPQNAKYGAKCWEIHSPEKSFIVYADHPGLKQEWLREMEKVVRARSTIESGKQRPAALWVPDDFTALCMVPDCDHKFNVINRRHHCRYCGRLVCGPCSTNKLPHWNKSNKSVRVCSGCYAENKELKHYTKTVKKRADTQAVVGLLGNKIVAENDEDSISVESDIDFEFWDSTESDAAAAEDMLPITPTTPPIAEDTLQSLDNIAQPFTRTRSIHNTQIDMKAFRRSTKKKRARMLTKEQIKAIHHRSASLGTRSKSERDAANNQSNARAIFSHQAKIFRLSYSHTPKKSTRTLYELADLSLNKGSSIDPTDTTHLHTNSFVSESLPLHMHHNNGIRSASSGDIYAAAGDEKKHSHTNTASLAMPIAGPSFEFNSSPRISSNRRLKLVGTGTLNIEAHQYDHEVLSMRLHTFTEVIDWNLDPYSMKPKPKDGFSCYLKALNVLSQQSEILLVRIKNRDIMASLLTILRSLGYYYEAENANRDDEDMDSQQFDEKEEGNTIALAKDTTLEEQKAEIDRAVFLIENSKKHENIKTLDVAKFLLAKSCPISVIQHAFRQAGVVMPQEVHSLAAAMTSQLNNTTQRTSKNKKLRLKEKRIALRNGKRKKNSSLLGSGFGKMHKSKSGGDTRFIKPIQLKQSYSADANATYDRDEEFVIKQIVVQEERAEEIPDADQDPRYQEALYQHDIRFCTQIGAADMSRVYMPSDKLDAHLRDIINEKITSTPVATNSSYKNNIKRNGSPSSTPTKDSKEEKKKKLKGKQRKKFSIWGNKK